MATKPSQATSVVSDFYLVNVYETVQSSTVGENLNYIDQTDQTSTTWILFRDKFTHQGLWVLWKAWPRRSKFWRKRLTSQRRQPHHSSRKEASPSINGSLREPYLNSQSCFEENTLVCTVRQAGHPKSHGWPDSKSDLLEFGGRSQAVQTDVLSLDHSWVETAWENCGL